MRETRDLMLDKLRQTGDAPQKVACNYRNRDGSRQVCNLQDLPAGTWRFFLAQSEKYLYVQRGGNRIDVLDLLLVHCLA